MEHFLTRGWALSWLVLRVSLSALAGPHPGLFFEASQVEALRQKAQTTHQAIYQPLRKVATSYLGSTVYDPSEGTASTMPPIEVPEPKFRVGPSCAVGKEQLAFTWSLLALGGVIARRWHRRERLCATQCCSQHHVARRFRACSALLLFVSACATSAPNPRQPAARNPTLANLQRAATLPWADEGRCVVREAAEPWPVLVERCFHALDHDRIEFHDPTGRCAVASAGAAAVGLGVCVLAAPELIVGAVIVTGVVLVGLAIKEAMEEYEPSRDSPEVGPVPETQPMSETTTAPEKPSPKQRPKPEPEGQDWPPPLLNEPLEQERRPECKPRRVPPKGGNRLHNKCADGIPFNAYRGANALVNGKAFDGLQVIAGVLWEVKTDSFDTYPIELQDIVIKKNVRDFLFERELARACGFDYRVGVRSATHKAALEYAEPKLEDHIVVMDWC